MQSKQSNDMLMLLFQASILVVCRPVVGLIQLLNHNFETKVIYGITFLCKIHIPLAK